MLINTNEGDGPNITESANAAPGSQAAEMQNRETLSCALWHLFNTSYLRLSLEAFVFQDL